jgi:hypothetical protein
LPLERPVFIILKKGDVMAGLVRGLCMKTSYWIKRGWGYFKKINQVLLLWLGFLITTFFVVTDHCNQEKMNYSLNSISHQPALKIINTPQIVGTGVYQHDSAFGMNRFLDSITTNDKQFAVIKKYYSVPLQFSIPLHNFPDSNIKSLDVVLTDWKCTLDLTIANTGNSKAILLFNKHNDFPDGSPFFRDAYLEGFRKLDKISKHPNEYVNQDFYKVKEILPNDTLKIRVAHNIEFPFCGIFTLHFIQYYSNDRGNIYDTYYTARFRLMLPDSGVTGKFIKKDSTHFTFTYKYNVFEFGPHFIDCNQTTFSYAKFQSDKIYNYYKKIKELSENAIGMNQYFP